MTDRDTFAAAALTGIIAASDDSEIKEDEARFLAKQAWLVADAMVRERALRPADAAYTDGISASGESKNHDAAPAATASEAENQAVGRRAETIAGEAGTGDTTTPVLWLVRYIGTVVNTQLVWASQAEAEAYARCARSPVDIIPLCDARVAAPPAAGVTLTAAEREAMNCGAHALYLRSMDAESDTLRGLLARAVKEGRSPDRMTKAPENVTEPTQEGHA